MTDSVRDMRARAAELAERLRVVIDGSSDNDWHLHGYYTEEWLTALLAAHDSYYRGGKPRCGATWASSNGNHPAGAVCADEAEGYWDRPLPFRPMLTGDVPLCRHHQQRMQDEARQFVREYEEWRDGGRKRAEEWSASQQKRDAARKAALEKLLPTLGSAQGTSKGKRHMIMPDGSTACGQSAGHPGGRWLDQPEDERCRRCPERWTYHPATRKYIDAEAQEK